MLEAGVSATAVSSQGVKVGLGQPPRCLRFRPSQANAWLCLGLGLKSTAPSQCDEIDFCVHCGKGGTLYVYEKGNQKLASSVKYSANSVIEIRVTELRVEVWLDGQRLDYSGTLQGPSTLYAMAHLAPGAEVVDIEWL